MCERCGGEITRRGHVGRAEHEARRFCSSVCANSRRRRALRDSYTIQENGCWEWQLDINADGYGRARDQVRGKTARAHRVMWMELVGPIPAGLTLDHLCRNRRCVNPAHLEPVTNRENVLRGMGLSAQNARKTHCNRGHEFTSANTLILPKGRRCRTCKLATWRAWYARHQQRAREHGIAFRIVEIVEA